MALVKIESDFGLNRYPNHVVDRHLSQNYGFLGWAGPGRAPNISVGTGIDKKSKKSKPLKKMSNK